MPPKIIIPGQEEEELTRIKTVLNNQGILLEKLLEVLANHKDVIGEINDTLEVHGARIMDTELKLGRKLARYARLQGEPNAEDQGSQEEEEAVSDGDSTSPNQGQGQEEGPSEEHSSPSDAEVNDDGKEVVIEPQADPKVRRQAKKKAAKEAPKA